MFEFAFSVLTQILSVLQLFFFQFQLSNECFKFQSFFLHCVKKINCMNMILKDFLHKRKSNKSH